MALAQDCPDLGLSSAQDQGRFCAELLGLLHAPYDPSGTRGDRDILDPETNRILDTIPEFGEAYRSDPRKTLALLKRIRDAGGLAN